ncbi:MAG: hypothetical protein KA158_11315 [Leucobacter sp.]|nr:hypothetical protein [Leucobacter sp.]
MTTKGIEATLTDAAAEYIARKGYDPSFGARPIRRLINFERAPDARLLANRVRLVCRGWRMRTRLAAPDCERAAMIRPPALRDGVTNVVRSC